MTVTEWLIETYQKGRFLVRNHAKCADGFSISIQAIEIVRKGGVKNERENS